MTIAAIHLEDMAKPEDEVLAATAAERAFDAEEHAVPRAEPEAYAVVGFEIGEAKILESRRDAAGVIKDRAVNRREDLPAVLRLQEQDVLVAEAELAEPAQIVRAPEGPLVVERDVLSGVGIGGGHERPQGDHAAVAHERHVLLQVDVDAVEVVARKVPIVEPLIRDLVLPAPARITPRFAQVHVGGKLVPQEVWLQIQARRRRREEHLADRTAFASPRANRGSEVIEFCADDEPWHGPHTGRRADLGTAKSIDHGVFTARIRAEAEEVLEWILEHPSMDIGEQAPAGEILRHEPRIDQPVALDGA